MQYDFGKKPENRRCRNQRSVGPWSACTNDLPDAKISLSSVKFSEKIQPEGFTPSRAAPQTGAANAGAAWAPPSRLPDLRALRGKPCAARQTMRARAYYGFYSIFTTVQKVFVAILTVLIPPKTTSVCIPLETGYR